MITVYKWLRRSPDGTLHSLVIGPEDREFYLTYSTEFVTHAPEQFPGAHPFVYTSLDKATPFLDTEGEELWECETEEVLPLESYAAWPDYASLAAFHLAPFHGAFIGEFDIEANTEGPFQASMAKGLRLMRRLQ